MSDQGDEQDGAGNSGRTENDAGTDSTEAEAQQQGQETADPDLPGIEFSYNVGGKAIYRSRDPIRNLKIKVIYKEVRCVALRALCECLVP